MLIGLVYSSVPLRDGLIWFFLSVPSFLLSTLVRFFQAQVECLDSSCSCWFGGGGLPWFGNVACLLFPSASAEVVG